MLLHSGANPRRVRMPFQISELVIRVGSGSPDGALAGGPDDAVTACKHGGSTCRPQPDPGTQCRQGGSTCRPQDDPGTQCRQGGSTCKPGKPGATASARLAELELVLGQLRAAAAEERAEERLLTTV
jgi:hypothetical protein